MGTMEKLAQSQEKVDEEIKKHFSKQEQNELDTVAAIIHLKANIDWYKLKHNQVSCADRAYVIAREVIKSFRGANESAIYNQLAKNFIFKRSTMLAAASIVIPILMIMQCYYLYSDIIDVVFFSIMSSAFGVLGIWFLLDSFPIRFYFINTGKIRNERKTD